MFQLKKIRMFNPSQKNSITKIQPTMDKPNFESLQADVQEIIDLMADKQYIDANYKLLDAAEYLDELLDHSEADDDLIEISKYQVLLNQLQVKITAAIGS